MFSKLYLAIAVAIALGFSGYAPAHDLTNENWIRTSVYRVSDGMDGLELTFVLAENQLQHRNIRCIAAPCPSGDAEASFALIIKNVSEVNKSLTFPSSQMVELELLEQNGASVGLLSASRSYAAMLSELVLVPGEEKVLSDVLVLDRSVTGKLKVVASVPSFESLPPLTQNLEVLAAP